MTPVDREEGRRLLAKCHGEWEVVEHTPTTVKTPDGRFSISWRSTDGSHDRKAEATCELIVWLKNNAEALLEEG